MATISFVDRIKIENFLTPPATSAGYVLDFSNASLQKFIGSVTGINIDDEKYTNHGSSKAKRLHSFFEKESDHIVGKLLLELVEYQKTLGSSYCSPKTQPDEIVKIANKLLQNGVNEEDNVAGKVYFEEINKQILNELEKAEFIIWIAVAWFTDSLLFDCLIKKKKQGLNIQIIIHDDNINKSSSLDYNQFETYRLPSWGSYSRNKMHHKFCIIDFKTVIHGSYNWTKNARHNGETIETSSGYNKAKQFSQEFMKLKLQAMNQ